MSAAESSSSARAAVPAAGDVQAETVAVDVSLAVPERFRPGFDSWSKFPRRFLAYGVYAAEAADGLLPPLARRGLSALSVLYVFATTADRSKRADQFQLHPAMRSYMSRRTAFENIVREWSATVTLPAILGAAVMAGARAALAARAPGAAAALSSRLSRYGPAAAAVVLSPLALAASNEVTERVVMQWAVRPTLDAWMPLPIIEAPDAAVDDVERELAASYPAPAQQRAAAAGTANASSSSRSGSGSGIDSEASVLSPEEQAEAAAISDEIVSAVVSGFSFGDRDELTQRRLAWALDGREDTPFPTTSDEEAVLVRNKVTSDPDAESPKLR